MKEQKRKEKSEEEEEGEAANGETRSHQHTALLREGAAGGEQSRRAGHYVEAFAQISV